MPPTSRGRGVWLIPLLLFLAMLLAAGLAFNLANLDTGGERMPGPGNSGTTPANPWGLLDPQTSEILFVLTLAAMIGTFVVMLLWRRAGTRYKRVLRPTTWADMLATVLAFGMLMLILFLWPLVASRASHGMGPANGTSNPSSNVTAIPSAGGIPLGIFLSGAVLASVVVLALFLRVGLNLGRRGAPASIEKKRLAAAQAVETALSELELGGDVRAAILACYGRFCRFLGARGIQSQEALTPRELEGLAVTDLAVSRESAESLTSLFEEARYSEHALGDQDRDRAVRSLERIRANLGV